jgi:hypothetical protein
VASPRPAEVSHEPGSLRGPTETLLRVRPLTAEIAHHPGVLMHLLTSPSMS